MIDSENHFLLLAMAEAWFRQRSISMLDTFAYNSSTNNKYAIA